MENSLKILDQQQVNHKLDRMAYQLYEENFEESSLFIAGI
ncbi:MAG: phosphoribosyltransferase, partial [Bacteroidetes bacterium SW_10_40_5]